MHHETKTLYGLIDNFLSGDINADNFEDEFARVFDFSDPEEDETDWNFFQKVRDLLEHYSFSDEDIKLHPLFFINAKQLKEGIRKIKSK